MLSPHDSLATPSSGLRSPRLAAAVTTPILDLEGRLAGRRRELAELRAAVDEAGRAGGGCTLLSGTPGVGKSTLMQAFGAEISGRNCVFAYGRYQDSAPPRRGDRAPAPTHPRVAHTVRFAQRPPGSQTFGQLAYEAALSRERRVGRPPQYPSSRHVEPADAVIAVAAEQCIGRL